MPTAAVDSTFSTVSAYVGFITGIVGIVLSVVAIVFAVVVQKDASRVNDQTIKTLVKIEADVSRLSADTASLIKAAWDKMLDGGQPATGHSSQYLTETSSGNADDAPARQGLVLEATKNIVEKSKNLENAADKAALVLKQLEKLSEDMQVKPELNREPASSRPSDQVENMARLLRMTDGVGRELLRIVLKQGHLTIDEFDRLDQDSTTRKSLSTLRDLKILVPLSGHGGHDENGRTRDPQLVYWIRPSMLDSLRATMLTFRVDEQSRIVAEEALVAAGYIDGKK